MSQISDITKYLENLAPLPYQEDYDNAGLIVGNPNTVVTGVLVCLDSTEEVIDEAIHLGCNLVVAHHPIIFRGLKKLTGKNYIERTIIKAIKNDIAIYATHTNLDNVSGGVNFKIAEKLQLQNVRILAPKKHQLNQMVVFVPQTHTAQVANALYEAGAGEIGNYDHCSFKVNGVGTFRPKENANPFVGTINQDENVSEDRLELIFSSFLNSRITAAMLAAHPYEVPAYNIYALENHNSEIGSGVVGTLTEPMEAIDFLVHIKKNMAVQIIRHTELLDKPVQRVAVCGGSGGFLLNHAIGAKADVFITADYKYHEFFDADKQIIIADIGHYESEQYTKELLQDYIYKKFTNFAVHLSKTNTNPINYH